MSLVWNERDDVGIEALQMLIDNGKSLMVTEGSKCCMEFEVKDYLKANAFLMDIFKTNDPEKQKEIENITGIHVISIGASKTVDNAAIRELLIQAIEKLQ